MQNLTAHYNIIFNANELLRQKQETYAAAFIDNYSQVLRVYQDTISRQLNTNDKELDGVISRANSVITDKEQSHYIGDAYMLLAKAAYLYGNYFNANEYCSYVIRTYPKNVNLVQDARSWRIRTLLNLGSLKEAKFLSDTALDALSKTKKKRDEAEVYAARLQYDITTGNYAEGEDMAKQAIKTTHDSRQRRRLTFILGQLQEADHKPAEAYATYSKVVGSNAVFEMAFNAELNRIRIAETQNGQKLSRIDQLRLLLRNENNKDFTDQIYFQIGELYAAEGKTDDAIKNYRLAIRYSTKNQNQKGLAYLRLADINFKTGTNYIVAKHLYDSTLLNLLPTYPNYRAIQLKANNLQVLAHQLTIIGHEDTLQALVKMPEKERSAAIEAMVKQRIAQQQAAAAALANSAFAHANAPTTQVAVGTLPSANAFYFYNVNAVSQGFTDFKRRWGNRKLEDNWRRSNRTNSDITVNTQNIAQQAGQAALPQNQQKTPDQVLGDNYRKEIVASLPTTEILLGQSNRRIYDAYYTLGTFYRDILEDPKDAITTFETILTRFPENTEKPAIYYNLYRLYSNIDAAKSDYYKNLLLKNYAETPFARVIVDPEYSRHLNDQDLAFNTLYNELYDLYVKKQYQEVTVRADELLKQYPDNKFAAQVAYLRALAAGHQETVDPFRADLQKILSAYPHDQLIAPLVNQHLTYIDSNRVELAARTQVLVENDDFLSPFLQPVTQPQQQTVVQLQPKTTPAPAKTPPVAAKPATSVFSLRDSTHYYFVVNVSTGTINLSSSRFGIGQFNRANYPPEQGISHHITYAGADNQLIYVGVFHNIAEVKAYARAIVPLMPQIMKVPPDKYSFFIITKENLDKLADKKMLDLYIDFYQKNY